MRNETSAGPNYRCGLEPNSTEPKPWNARGALTLRASLRRHLSSTTSPALAEPRPTVQRTSKRRGAEGQASALEVIGVARCPLRATRPPRPRLGQDHRAGPTGIHAQIMGPQK